MSARRFIFLFFAAVIGLHFLSTLILKDRAYHLPSLSQLRGNLGLSHSDVSLNTNYTPPILPHINDPPLVDSSDRANATFVLLCRNSDLEGAISSIQQMEDRFNRYHGYPWVLLNEEPFTQEFKERVAVLVNGPIHFGQIPHEHWFQPDWIDEDKAKAGRLSLMAQGSVPYRNMCRFNSGFFFHHELLKPYRYYWRVEPYVRYFCDVNYDPFKFMETNNKTYGFTISLVEWEQTIPTLWSTVKEFMAKHPQYVHPDNAMKFLSDDGGNSYNLCHFWSNFEIADLDFWRGEAYQKFFDFLDSKGGFYYEIGLHYIFSLTNENYGRATSIENLKKHVVGQQQPNVPPYKVPIPDEYYISKNITSPQGRKANAAIVMLARNGDLNGVIISMKQMEDRFNKKFNYPYVFLNEKPFDDNFKKRVTELTDSEVQFGLIPPEHWYQPPEIDEEKATKAREQMVKDRVIYGDSVPYRNMCRFNSGFFYRHELLKPFQYYWRVEPDVKFFCDLDYDPFLIMEDGNKMYGFTISLYEYEATIPTLWDAVKEFIEQNPDLVSEDNAMAFLSDDGGRTYNRCHFWSNFEIGNLDLWRGEAYSKFFDHLDKKGGFYYERWGDAPVHSIGAALFARKDQIHFFNDIGYRHEPFQHCPQGDAHKRGKCWCDSAQNFDYEWYSCLNRYDKLFE
ncbi:hypothetical protein CVT26_010813 [Gymnopilus dilepis]|uniref:Glycosyltransferase family 15 protein n=1 Tax=Gymnopilus dilepis TaxID=231916 RepID=A0A409VII5_9AGAR|nr:hypothetical protein CVT26_010813 [Gymnopilus dilepis]